MSRVRTVSDDDWADWADGFANDEALIAWTWGHLPEALAAAHVAEFRRWKRGLRPRLAQALAEQIAVAIVEEWSMFGEAIEMALDKFKKQRSKR